MPDSLSPATNPGQPAESSGSETASACFGATGTVRVSARAGARNAATLESTFLLERSAGFVQPEAVGADALADGAALAGSNARRRNNVIAKPVSSSGASARSARLCAQI